MRNANGVSRGDRNRNARLVRLREQVPLDHAIVGIDLADQPTQPVQAGCSSPLWFPRPPPQ
jgi:hypothetical protein